MLFDENQDNVKYYLNTPFENMGTIIDLTHAEDKALTVRVYCECHNDSTYDSAYRYINKLSKQLGDIIWEYGRIILNQSLFWHYDFKEYGREKFDNAEKKYMRKISE